MPFLRLQIVQIRQSRTQSESVFTGEFPSPTHSVWGKNMLQCASQGTVTGIVWLWPTCFYRPRSLPTDTAQAPVPSITDRVIWPNKSITRRGGTQEENLTNIVSKIAFTPFNSRSLIPQTWLSWVQQNLLNHRVQWKPRPKQSRCVSFPL